jgi:hypothetical protein
MALKQSRNGVPYSLGGRAFLDAEADVYIKRLQRRWADPVRVAWAQEYANRINATDIAVEIETDGFLDATIEQMYLRVLNAHLDQELRYGALAARRSEHFAARAYDEIASLDGQAWCDFAAAVVSEEVTGAAGE